MTFGHIRRLMIDASLSPAARTTENDAPLVGIGCASLQMTPRELATSACAEDELHCWHRCYSSSTLTDEFGGISEESCGEQGLTMECVDSDNPDKLWDAAGQHGPHFIPMCYNDTMAWNHTNHTDGGHDNDHDHTDGGHDNESDDHGNHTMTMAVMIDPDDETSSVPTPFHMRHVLYSFGLALIIIDIFV